jgi:capsular polysaccharide transport system ATP-binding protein
MIELRNVTDRPDLFGEHRLLLEAADLLLPKGRYALLSETPELHPALIDILAGLRPPRYGYVQHERQASWPVGRMGFVRGKLTGVQTARFICSLYGIDYRRCMDFLTGILTEPEYLYKKIMFWPAFIRQEFTFSLSLVPSFEVFFIDSVMPTDRSRFGKLWSTLFGELLVGRGLILSTASVDQMLDYCAKALIYEDGGFRVDDDLEACIKRFPLRRSRVDQSGEGSGPDDAELEESAAGDLMF